VLAVGLMSGTSLDGVDAALVRIEPRGARYAVDVRRALTIPFAPEFAERVRAALPPHGPPPSAVARLDAELGVLFGDAARAAAGDAKVDFVASHGLTLFHDGDARLTAQIGDPFAIRERIAATVVADFRRADCAAGGQGAPLVPYVDALLFSSPDRYRVALNVGGIANVTLLPRDAAPPDVLGWDTGPGNMLLDAFVARRTAGRQRCDRDGRHASSGSVDIAALARMRRDPYFELAPPKSTGRERFGEAFLDAHAAALDPLSLEDGCATLLALTVSAIAGALRDNVPVDAEVVVSGGGAENPAMLRALAEALAPATLTRADALGVDVRSKEALAFVVLAYELLRGRPAGLSCVTGARHPSLLGAVAPYELEALLARVAGEVRAARGARGTHEPA
jgi:anhydro-N-acetylmuramic acid kinase